MVPLDNGTTREIACNFVIKPPLKWIHDLSIVSSVITTTEAPCHIMYIQLISVADMVFACWTWRLPSVSGTRVIRNGWSRFFWKYSNSELSDWRAIFCSCDTLPGLWGVSGKSFCKHKYSSIFWFSYQATRQKAEYAVKGAMQNIIKQNI